VLKFGFGQWRIRQHPDEFDRLRTLAQRGRITLVFSAHDDAVVPDGSARRTRVGRNGDWHVATEKGAGCGQWARPEALANALTQLTEPSRRVGKSFRGFWAWSGVRWRRAAESGFRTPSASRSVVYTGVPGCCRQASSNPPASTASKPSSSTSCRTTALAFASSPATGKAIRPGDPRGRPRSSRWRA